MLYSTITPPQKRAASASASPPATSLQFPGAFNPLSARLIEEKGFEGVYISGAVLAADLGLPDIGLTTLTEVAGRGRQIARMTDLPAIIDADTGFGEPMNVARTVQTLEDAGLAGCHIEDQVNPKRCGHLDGKAVVDEDTAIKRIRAAVDARRDPNFLIMARTDIRAVDGLDAALDRAKALVDAGADAIFPEAMRDLDEFAAIRAAVDVPILANMTEFGKSDAVHGGAAAPTSGSTSSSTRSRCCGSRWARRSVRWTRSRPRAPRRRRSGDADPRRLYDLIDYEAYNHFDTGVFNFQIPG